jgi:WhiB family redox-sensing transcriptional regulator
MSTVTTHAAAAPDGAAAPRPVPAVNYDRASWRESAACSDADTEIFFPVGSGRLAAAETQQAKQICARCPVQQECLMYALASSQEFGTWGGYDETERRPLHLAWRNRHGVPRQAGPEKEMQSWSG